MLLNDTVTLFCEHHCTQVTQAAFNLTFAHQHLGIFLDKGRLGAFCLRNNQQVNRGNAVLLCSAPTRPPVTE